MSKKDKKNIQEIEEKEVIKPKKKKMTKLEKNRLIMKIAGWIMAIVMLVGTLISIFGMLIYYN